MLSKQLFFKLKNKAYTASYKRSFTAIWGTYCVVKLECEPFKPTFNEWYTYVVNCVSLNVEYQPWESVKKYWYLVQVDDNLSNAIDFKNYKG